MIDVLNGAVTGPTTNEMQDLVGPADSFRDSVGGLGMM